MFKFEHITRVLGYDGVVEQQLAAILQDHESEKVLVITDKILRETGLIDKIVEYIEDAGIEVTVFDEVEPDPPIRVVDKCIKIIEDEGIDTMVAVGGGSSMDTMKAANMVKFGNKPLEEMADKIEGVPNTGIKTIAIPTTAGTGSEVTGAAVITNEKTQRKITLMATAYAPTVALLDPQIIKAMPSSITRITGLDALFHAIECVTTNSTNVLNDAIAFEAAKIIIDNLPISIKDGNDIDARSNMGIGSMMAGIAFINNYLHLGHAFGHTIGSIYHIPHGSAIAVTFPWVYEFVADTATNKARRICQLFGKDTAGVADGALPGLIRDTILEFMESIGEKKFAEYEKVKEEDIEMIAEKVMLEQLLLPFSPKRMGKAEAMTILTRAYHNIRD